MIVSRCLRSYARWLAVFTVLCVSERPPPSKLGYLCLAEEIKVDAQILRFSVERHLLKLPLWFGSSWVPKFYALVLHQHFGLWSSIPDGHWSRLLASDSWSGLEHRFAGVVLSVLPSACAAACAALPAAVHCRVTVAVSQLKACLVSLLSNPQTLLGVLM